MISLGIGVSICGVLLAGILLVRGTLRGYFNYLPIFYSYLVYALGGTLILYGVYLMHPKSYATAYWYYYLVSILVEFSVLIEISDQIFRAFPPLRQVGRALTISITAILGITYLFPSIIHAQRQQTALFDFTLRASATKLVIILVLLVACRQLRLGLSKSAAGLMLGFALYQGINVANYAAAKAFNPHFYREVFWIMGPAASTLCMMVWLISLWNYAPEALPAGPAGSSGNPAVELTRFNNELTRYLER